MFRRLDDFQASFAHARESYLKILDAIPESAAGTAVADGHRDLRRMAFHLVETLIEMPTRTGLKLPHGEAFLANQPLPLPATMAEIRQAYVNAADALQNALEAWNDATLEVSDDMYGQQWKRGETLGILLTHQTHHVGQMTVLMRQAGLRVPGIYGPAKEEWEAYHMPAPAI